MTVTRGAATEVTTLDGFGRPIAGETVIAGAPSVKTTTRYDAAGRVVYAGLPFTGTADVGVDVTYDGLGRPRRETHEDGNFRERTYGAGTITVRDEAARETLYTLSAFGHPDDAVRANEWTHVAATYDPSAASASLYIDGVRVPASGPVAGGAIVSAGEPMTIGEAPGVAFTGRVDEIRLYSRPLAAADIVRDMNTPID